MSLRNEKQCSGCGDFKHPDEFRPQRRRCRECERAAARVRAAAWHAKNRKSANAGRRERYAKRTEAQRQRDRERDAQRRQTAAHREYQAKWRKKSADSLAEYHKEWVKQNPEKVREHRRRESPQAAERRRAYQRERRANQREMLRQYAREQRCTDCGTTEGRLEFDHRDKSTKSYNVTQMLGYSESAIWAEVAKCDIRCGTCHRQRHAGERSRK